MASVSSLSTTLLANTANTRTRFFITRQQQQQQHERRCCRAHGGKLVGETWVQQSDAEDYIEEGQRAFQSEEYATAIALFEKALTSEGSGTKRDRTKPAELSLGEKQSAYYNLAASHGKMGHWDLAFASLELTFQSGYANGRLYGLGRAARDFQRLEMDKDLEELKKDERWKTILTKYRVRGSEIAFQLDPSNSSIGKAIEMMSKKNKK
jgi:tetratricopeptide (TPR) repeat protein